ncbi:hypothetical protein TNCT_619401 [Trichonephila clavata]|uniref:Uncharacterized protein n=1 Tax=Trichonephila clavata TaxID=2740835 RepID=A0A8X6HRW1_TRICU|nr:hypothetical protein TNCT_619401 [Trichonephila clavata]
MEEPINVLHLNHSSKLQIHGKVLSKERVYGLKSNQREARNLLLLDKDLALVLAIKMTFTMSGLGTPRAKVNLKIDFGNPLGFCVNLNIMYRLTRIGGGGVSPPTR